MTAITLEGWARKHSRLLDLLIALAMSAGVFGLFLFDISAPRGEVDGVGYAALVALGVRFNDRVILACAALTTLLTLLGSLLVPDAGISVAGMWANRTFAILEIWIVAIILVHRLRLEAYVTGHEKRLQVHQATLGTIIREAILSKKPQEERLCFITRQAAEALGADYCAIMQRSDSGGPVVRIVNIWDRQRNRHFEAPEAPPVDVPGYWETMRKELIVSSDDVRTSDFHRPRLPFFEKVGVRAVLTAEAVQGSALGWVSFWFAEPHRWTDQEGAFARALANLVSLLFSIDRNDQTLAALDRVSEGIFLEDSSGNVTYANPAAAELSDPVSGGGFLHPEASLSGGSDMHEMSSGDRELEVQRLRLPDGGILTRINDVTQRNAALAERRRLEERLQRGARMEAIGQLAGGVAHDFNNILGAILGFAGLLRQDMPDASPQQEFADRILKACERGKDLVEQIMAFARVRAVERGVVDLALALERSRDELTALAPRGVTLAIRPADMALPVSGSGVQIGQLINNLFLNACDACLPEGGAVTITACAAEEAEIAALAREKEAPDERSWGEVRSGQAYALLRVADTGSGIAPPILDRIFDPFFTTKGRQHGTGLGLAVVHGVVQSLGGVCHLRSAPGKGTVFSIYAPLLGEAGESEAAAAEPADLRGAERVLIVDDEADIADMLSIGLERLGYESVSVNDPQDALAAFAESPAAFDVLVTDQVMPGLRGLDLIRRLKEIKPGLTAILCTGYSDGANAEIALQAGADAFCQKPVDARQIALVLRRLMDGAG